MAPVLISPKLGYFVFNVHPPAACVNVKTKQFSLPSNGESGHKSLFSLLPTHIFSLCLSFRKQEDLVQSVRRRLEEALTADMLAHIKDTAADTAGGTEEKAEQVDKDEL